MVGTWEEIQPPGASQRVTQSLALVEGDTFILFTLDNQCGYCNPFSRPISNLSEAVFVKGVAQTDPIKLLHDVRNRVRGMPL